MRPLHCKRPFLFACLLVVDVCIIVLWLASLFWTEYMDGPLSYHSPYNVHLQYLHNVQCIGGRFVVEYFDFTSYSFERPKGRFDVRYPISWIGRIGFVSPTVNRDDGRLLVDIPLWIVACVLTLGAIATGRVPVPEAESGHCAVCGYDLTGNLSGRCPECGSAVGAAEHESHECV